MGDLDGVSNDGVAPIGIIAKDVTTKIVDNIVDRGSRLYPQQKLFPYSPFAIDIATWPDQRDHFAAYLPENDKIYFFGRTFDEVEAGHEAVAYIAGLHEADHAIYFRQSLKSQIAVNNIIVNLILTNPEATTTFQRFVDALYARPGAKYLNAHRFSNREVSSIISSDDKKPGLKDTRQLVATVDGKQENLYLGLVITEFFAYMTTGHHQSLMDAGALDRLQATDCVKVAQEFRLKFIDTDTGVMDLLSQNGGHGLYRDIPDFMKYILNKGDFSDQESQVAL